MAQVRGRVVPEWLPLKFPAEVHEADGEPGEP